MFEIIVGDTNKCTKSSEFKDNNFTVLLLKLFSALHANVSGLCRIPLSKQKSDINWHLGVGGQNQPGLN